MSSSTAVVAIYRSLLRHAIQTPDALPPDAFLKLMKQSGLSMSAAFAPATAKDVLSDAFREKDPASIDGLDFGFDCLRFSVDRAAALSHEGVSRHRRPVFAMEAPVLRGETINIRFFEPRYLKLAEEALLGDRRFVYLSTEVQQRLDRKGGKGVGTLMTIMGDPHDGAAFRSCNCLAGPRVIVSQPGREAPPNSTEFVFPHDPSPYHVEAVDERFVTPYTQQMRSNLPLTRVNWEPHTEGDDQGNQSDLAEAVAVAMVCRSMLPQVQEGVLATWIARCGVPPPLEQRPEDFSLWLSACLTPSSSRNAQQRQRVLEETAAERLVRAYKALQLIPGTTKPP